MTNEGNVDLAGVSVSDPLLEGTYGTLSTPTESMTADGILEVGETWTYTGSYAVQQSDLNDNGGGDGDIDNTATVESDELDDESDSAEQPIVQNPSIDLTKTPDPLIYSAAGQVIHYTLVVTNDGNVDLTNVGVTDSLGITVTCVDTTLAPGDSTTCTGSYTILPIDVLDDFTGVVTNTATALGIFGPQNQEVFDTATAEVTQVPPTAQITPTDTSCSDFSGGTADDLTDLFYLVNKKGEIGSVAEGVMFYYSEITAPSDNFEIVVQQTNNNLWPPIEIQKIGQVILWTDACAKTKADLTTTYDPMSGKVTMQVDGTAAGVQQGDVFILSVKYVPSKLAGTSVSEPHPSVKYTFVSYLDENEIIPSWAGVIANPKN